VFSLKAVNILHINIEDCGGIGGYQNLVEALSNRRHPEHQELRAWAGQHYDPKLFSVQAINSALAALVALGVTG
jgi:hypothetical protein